MLKRISISFRRNLVCTGTENDTKSTEIVSDAILYSRKMLDKCVEFLSEQFPTSDFIRCAIVYVDQVFMIGVEFSRVCSLITQLRKYVIHVLYM